MALETELETFNRELPVMLADPAKRGKFVLIHGAQLEGFYPTFDAALEAAYEKFGFRSCGVGESP